MQQVCRSHGHLCDTCSGWERPGAPMVHCWDCGTPVHAT
ncbi:unnamed protein product, partial [Choristocarpus tenellus]